MKKRSKYRPKGVILDTLTYVKSGLVPMVNLKDQLIALQLKNHLALEALRTGNAVKEDIDTIINAFNISEALAKQDIGQDYKAEIKEAQDALYECAKRGVERNYSFVMKGTEIKAINFVMQLHDEQLQIATVKDLELATNYVRKCIVNKLARPILEKQ
jgi:TusA-related sulfurtransferase